MKHANKTIDHVTGVETTGHVWDEDLRELNKPLPKWWLYVLYATIVWSIGYWAVYPAWPTLSGYTQGYFGHSQRAAVTAEIADAKKAQEKSRQAIAAASLQDIVKQPELLAFARAGGAAAFGDNCAGCHGRGAQGFTGYPNLNDDAWIWGGTLDAIHKTISFGIRSGHPDTHATLMPRFGVDQMLTSEQIGDVAAYVRSLSIQGSDAAASERGKTLFAEQCAACHGENAKGNTELGAPDLTDADWLYGNTPEAVALSIKTGRGGIMPAWTGRIDPETLKMLAVYVHSLGGGTN